MISMVGLEGFAVNRDFHKRVLPQNLYRSSQRQFIPEWMWPCSSKALFTRNQECQFLFWILLEAISA